MRRPLAAAALAAALAGCASAPPVQGRPSTREGWLQYAVRDLRLDAPAGWRATGDAGKLQLEAPDGRARLEVTVPASAFRDERACLVAAEERIAGGAAPLERARRHPTRLAGRPGQSLEGDQGAWHVWAVAACDGGVQYRIFLTAATPAAPEVLELWRGLLTSARIGGEA